MFNLLATLQQMPTSQECLKMHSYVFEKCTDLRNNLQIGSLSGSISQHLTWLNTPSYLTCNISLYLHNMLPLHAFFQSSLSGFFTSSLQPSSQLFFLILHILWKIIQSFTELSCYYLGTAPILHTTQALIVYI